MKGKIHISKDGVPRKCTAKGECKLGKHFDNKEEAQEYADKLNQETQENQAYINNITEFRLNKIYQPTYLNDDVSFPKKGDFHNTITYINTSDDSSQAIEYDEEKYKKTYEKIYEKELKEKEEQLKELNKKLEKHNIKVKPEVKLETRSYKYAESTIQITTETIDKNKITTQEDVEKIKKFIKQEETRKQKENEQINKYVERANLKTYQQDKDYATITSNMMRYKGFNKKAKEPTININDKTYVLKHTTDENNIVEHRLLITNKNNEKISGTFYNIEQMHNVINITKDKKNLLMNSEQKEKEIKRLQDNANNNSKEYKQALKLFVQENNDNYIKTEKPTLKFDNGNEIELSMSNNKYVAKVKTKDKTETLKTNSLLDIENKIDFLKK